MIRSGFCSDIRLGHHFRHMSSRSKVQFEAKLRICWAKLIDQCLKERLDALFIVGNLFSDPNPKNQAKDEVAEKLVELTASNIQVFILPGPKETPLYHANDILPHYIFDSFPDVNIVTPAPNQGINDPRIEKPLVETTITFTGNGATQKREIEVFAPNSAFLKPQELELYCRGDPKKISIMMLYGPFLGDEKNEHTKKNPYAITSVLLKRINDCKIDCLIIGGSTTPPDQELIDMLSYDMILAPPAVRCGFNLATCDAGVRVMDLTGQRRTSKLLPFDGFEVIQKGLSVTGKNPDEVNDLVIQLIREYSDAKNGYFQLRLDGTLPREKYQMLDIYDFIDRGKKMNQYFELAEEIVFSERGVDIGGLHPLRFIETMIREQMESEELAGESKILHQVLSKIRDNWKNLQ
ncbi:MAG: hypothetical protein ACTSQI_12645 [Candidatus Helarchaeota archaeon]